MPKNFHTKIEIPPLIIPASAPYRVVRFQNSENSMTGPKAAPNPAHAKDTISKIELSGFHAIKMEIIAITTTVAREIIITVLSLAFLFIKPL